jgi:hypothetical protein
MDERRDFPATHAELAREFEQPWFTRGDSHTGDESSFTVALALATAAFAR